MRFLRFVVVTFRSRRIALRDRDLKVTAKFVLLEFLFGCRRNEPPPMSLDTIRAAGDTTSLRPQQDTSKAKADTTHSNLPPMAKAIEPDRLAAYLPKMLGWTSQGELQKELQIRENFNRSRVNQTYTNGSKKVKVQIDDFAYI